MEEIFSIFATLNLSPPIVNNKCKSISHAYAIAKATGSNQVVAITSKNAFLEYDPDHPERIVCILLNVLIDDDSKIFHVIVNNREVNKLNSIRMWFGDGSNLKTRICSQECMICYKKPKQCNLCTHCMKITCMRCYEKISSRGVNNTHATKCPTCRQWSLIGDAYGTPHDKLIIPPKKVEAVNAIDDLVDNVLAHLDGQVYLIKRIEDKLHMHPFASFLRLSGTNRVTDGTKAKAIRKMMHHLVETEGAKKTVRIYVLRMTYAIDVKPITEISLFQITATHSLIQCSVNAWTTGLFDDETDEQEKFTKVTYIKPEMFYLSEEMNAILKESSVTFFGISATGYGFNWDNDMDGNPATMHIDMVRHITTTCVMLGNPAFLINIKVTQPKGGNIDTIRIVKFGYQLAMDSNNVVIIEKVLSRDEAFTIARNLMNLDWCV